MSKISQYANSVAALGTDDLFDVSEKISSSPDVYESRKMTGAVLATFIQSYTSNILNTNSLTLGGNYTHDLAGNQLVFDGGNLGVVGEIGVTADDVARTNVFVAGDYLGQSILSVKNAGNVGVGTLTPDASAVLDTSSTDSGFLVPRMTTAQKNAIATPAESLLVYDTDLNRHEFYNSAGSWAALDSDTNFANTDLTVGAGREHTLTDTVRIKGGTFQVEGLNTLGTASAFEIYDGDGTPSKLWDWRNNGDLIINQSSKVDNGGTLNFNGGFFKVTNSADTIDKFYIDTGHIYGEITITPAEDIKLKSNLTDLRILTNGVQARYNGSNKCQVGNGISYFMDNKFIVNSASGFPSFIGTEVISLQGRTAVKGTDALGTSTAFEIYDGAGTPALKFEVRNNGDIYTNGTQGLSATYTFGGGSTGDIASMTFTNGILTAVTTVP